MKEDINKQIKAMYALYSSLVGPDRLIVKAGKLDALELMRSENVSERLLALQRLVMEDPTLDVVPEAEAVPAVIALLEEELAEQVARRAMEDRIEKRVTEKMDEKQEQYIQEIRAQVLKETAKEVETPHTKKKLAELKKKERIKLSATAMEFLRPATMAEIVGQERAVAALSAKLASPYPQHLILYGPPGVGKTTAARLVLEEAKRLKYTPFQKSAAFVEVDGATLRWDPRDMTNPLLGSVHDPIYQGARRDFADTGIPEPKTGLVTDAHGGILFIDEIGEMDPLLQNKLLKVLEDKRVFFESPYYDSTDAGIPAYIRQLFEKGAPADFVLIGATTRDPSEITPAIRSRCAEIYFEPLTPEHIRQIIVNAATRLQVGLADGVAELISEYTIEGRKAINILSDAYGAALYARGDQPKEAVIEKEDVYRVLQVARLTPYVMAKASNTREIGRIFGLGVASFLGSVIEIETMAFPAREKGKGALRFNETAGSMAKDSVFNAAAVVRRITGNDLADYDVHVNIIGGGNIEGPSAGAAITATIISAIQEKPIRQDVAVTGEVSIRGRVKAVGGVFEKAYGAKQAGIRTMVIPKENVKDIPEGHLGLDIRPVETVDDMLAILFQ